MRQRRDASIRVDVHYNLADADNDPCIVWVSVSDNGGAGFRVVARTFTGDFGNGIAPVTNKTVARDAGADSRLPFHRSHGTGISPFPRTKSVMLDQERKETMKDLAKIIRGLRRPRVLANSI